MRVNCGVLTHLVIVQSKPMTACAVNIGYDGQEKKNLQKAFHGSWICS